MASPLTNLSSKITQILRFLLVVFFIITMLVLIREIYLGVFKGIGLDFWMEVMRNNLVLGSTLVGSRLIFLLVNRFFPWQKNFNRGIVIHVIIMLIYSWAIMSLYAFFLEGKIDDNVASRDRHFILIIFSAVLNMVLNFSIEFSAAVQAWKKTLVETERLEKERVNAELVALKNQVNPHFLFNSLNTLSSLVYKDAEKADDFIQQLALVYRYLLENKEKDLVTLSEELHFIQSYLYLLKIRFKEGFDVTIEIPEQFQNSLIPPNTLQILVENAVKHNVIAKKAPLAIKIAANANYIIVSNNLQLRRNKEYSSQLGLKNISIRYQYLVNKQIIVENGNTEFVVKIPLITNQNLATV